MIAAARFGGSCARSLEALCGFIFGSTFLKRFEVDDEVLKRIETSDEDLLRFAFRWLRLALFGEKTVTIRPEAMPPSSAANHSG